MEKLDFIEKVKVNLPKLIKAILALKGGKTDELIGSISEILSDIGCDYLKENKSIESLFKILGSRIDLIAISQSLDEILEKINLDDKVIPSDIKNIQDLKVIIQNENLEKLFINSEVTDFNWIILTNKEHLPGYFKEKFNACLKNIMERENIHLKSISQSILIEDIFVKYIENRRKLTEEYCRENKENLNKLWLDHIKNVDSQLTKISEGVEELKSLINPIDLQEKALNKPERLQNSLPPIWNVPFNRNNHFTGRKKILDEINKIFTANQSPLAIYGLGGVGKTNVVLEYIYKNINKYDIIWWIRAEKEEVMTSDIINLAEQIGLNIANVVTEDIIEQTRQWLSRNGDWLLVFDNLNNIDIIEKYIPQAKTGNVLITSQNSLWNGINSISLEIFERNESIDFISKRVLYTNADQANTLAETLGDLPLALNQAISYINVQKIDLINYIDRYKSKGINLLNKSKCGNNTIQITWDLAFNEIGKDCYKAMSLLGILAFLPSENIPRLMIDKIPSIKNEIGKPLYTEEELEDIIEILQKYSFIKIDNKFISIHRLLQSQIREDIKRDNNDTFFLIFLNEYLLAIFDINTQNETNNKKQMVKYTSLFPHVLYFLEYCKLNNKENIANPRLIQALSFYFKVTGDFKKSEEYLLWEVNFAKKFVSNNPIALSVSLSNLAGFYLHFSKNKEAISYLKKAIQILNKANMQDTKYMYAAKATLIRPYAQIGDLDKAVDIIEELSGKTNLFDSGVYNIFHHNAGLVYLEKQDFEKAEFYVKKSIDNNIKQEVPNVVNLGTSYANLSQICLVKRKYTESKDYAEKAMETYKQCYEDNHPYVLNCLERLIDICFETNEPERKLKLAKKLYELTINASYKDEDREITAYGYIIEALIDCEKYFESLEYCRKALKSAKKSLGIENQTTIALLTYYHKALHGYAFSQENLEVRQDCLNEIKRSIEEFDLPMLIAVPKDEVAEFLENNPDCQIINESQFKQ